jgi:hypothetical protein
MLIGLEKCKTNKLAERQTLSMKISLREIEMYFDTMDVHTTWL